MSAFIESCQSCNNHLTEFLDLGYHPATSVLTHSRSDGPKTLYPLVIFWCDSCGLVQSGYATDPKILFGGKEYFYWSSATASFRKHLEDLADLLMAEFKPKFVVDIGGNDGLALKKYEEAGVKVLNVDPSSVAAKAMVPTLNGFFNYRTAEEIVKEKGQADLITAYNVFAHTPLQETMRGIDRLLEPNGVFVSESQYLMDNISELAYDTLYLEHLRYYSLHTMISLLARWGFKVFKAERVIGIGSSIRVFACRAQKSMELDASVSVILKLEDDFGLQNLKTYTDFADRVKQSKTDLLALLWKLKKEGNRIAGIGAAGRSTTIMNYCMLGPDLIDYLAETNQLKIGCFSAGMEIPIVSEDKLFEDQPHYAVNFLWHLPQIASKLKAKGFKGKVIQPLPAVKILD